MRTQDPTQGALEPLEVGTGINQNQHVLERARAQQATEGDREHRAGHTAVAGCSQMLKRQLLAKLGLQRYPVQAQILQGSHREQGNPMARRGRTDAPTSS